ncbi:MAG TPA: IPT/TIG domain-containing protein, partial [Planctomycetota bacterium]|nr:IPT/TIG domain-containing protein [Planctomycetota bacterium]
MKVCRIPFILTCAVIVGLFAERAHAAASVSGFGGNGTGWTLNGGGITVTNDVATLTDGNNGEGTSVFFNTPVTYSGGFTASFIYTPSGNIAADGATFCLQTQAVTAVGTNGGGLGYATITPSAALELNIYTGAAGGVGYAFGTGGTINTNSSTQRVVLNSGNPITITIVYNSTTTNLAVTMSEANTTHTFSTSTTVNLSTVLAGDGNTAFVGFTGGTGGLNSIQTISSFGFEPNGSVSGPPTVTAVSPTSGPNVGGFGLSITGTNFDVTTAPPTVSFAMPSGGATTVNANHVVWHSTTQLTCNFPATNPSNYTGTADVIVTNANAQAGTGTALFTYTASPAPTISAATPNTGATGGGNTVTITGTNFSPTATVKFGGVSATGVTVLNSTTLLAKAPAGAGTVNVVVTNPDGQFATLTGAFTYINYSGDVISVNFQATDNGGSAALGSTEVTGFIPVANWNNAVGNVQATAQAVNFSTGGSTRRTTSVPSGASITWSANNTWANGDDNTPTDKLLHGYLDDNNSTNPATNSQCTITNIPFARYDVYVICHGDTGDGSILGKYWADDASIVHFFADGSTNFQFCRSETAQCSISDGIQNSSQGNVVRFQGLTFSSLKVTTDSNARNGSRAPLNGIQIV